MRPYKVNVAVRVMVWTRPDLQERQFEIIRAAAPSVLFLVSDGGRNQHEQELIKKSRAIVENIDWECEVHKLYSETNQGMYATSRKAREYIWAKVDRCIFLEDDYEPAVSFFQFCAELLEKYKDDTRIEMITGNNVFGTYPEAEPYDYFFSQVGWSIWGTATWRRVAQGYQDPLPYCDNTYIQKCLKDNLTPFWYNKAIGYCKGEKVDGHVPGTEYFHAVNSALYHRVSIIPTKNMICNGGVDGVHFKSRDDVPAYMNLPVYELEFPLRHPDYVIDDKQFGDNYEKLLEHKPSVNRTIRRTKSVIRLVRTGGIWKKVHSKLHRVTEK